jgi:hypothetical protein
MHLATASSAHVYHRKGSTAYKIWDESNDGPGSGLNADLLDGLQASQFLRSDTSVTLAGNLNLDGTRLSIWNTGTYDHNEMWRLYNPSTSQNLYIHNPFTNKTALNIHSSGRLDVLGDIYSKSNLVMTTGNGGPGSNFDADMVDGLHAAQFLRSDQDDDTVGRLTIKKDSNEQIRVGYDVARDPSINFYRGTTRKGSIEYINSGNYFRMLNSATGEGLRIGSGNNGLEYLNGGTYNKVWHAGNDGSGSGLDADTLDGKHFSDISLKLLFAGYMYNSTNSSPSIHKYSGGVTITATRTGQGDYRLTLSGSPTNQYMAILYTKTTNGNYTSRHVGSVYTSLSTITFNVSDVNGARDQDVFIYLIDFRNY